MSTNLKIAGSKESGGRAVVYPRCPHCLGEHWGQRFDDCPYVGLAVDPNVTEEQRKNAASWLEDAKK